MQRCLILLFCSLLFPLLAFEPAKVKVIVSVLNVRDLPSKSGDVITTLTRGDIVNAIEESKQIALMDDLEAHWYKVVLPNKKTGWVFGGYMSFEIDRKSGLPNPLPACQLPARRSTRLHATRNVEVSGRRATTAAPGRSTRLLRVYRVTKGLLYAGTRNGLYKLSSTSGYTDEHGIRGNVVTQINTGKKQQIWVALDDSALAYSE